MTNEEKWHKEATQRFKDKLCREFKVSSVNDLPMTDQDYTRLLDMFQFGYAEAKGYFINRILENIEKMTREETNENIRK